jgi:hypothetical protein
MFDGTCIYTRTGLLNWYCHLLQAAVRVVTSSARWQLSLSTDRRRRSAVVQNRRQLGAKLADEF